MSDHITLTKRTDWTLEALGHTAYLLGERDAYLKAQQYIDNPSPAPNAIAIINMELRRIEKALVNRFGTILTGAACHDVPIRKLAEFARLRVDESEG